MDVTKVDATKLIERDVPSGYDAICPTCRCPFVFVNSRQTKATLPEQFCSGICERERHDAV